MCFPNKNDNLPMVGWSNPNFFRNFIPQINSPPAGKLWPQRGIYGKMVPQTLTKNRWTCNLMGCYKMRKIVEQMMYIYTQVQDGNRDITRYNSEEFNIIMGCNREFNHMANQSLTILGGYNGIYLEIKGKPRE